MPNRKGHKFGMNRRVVVAAFRNLPVEVVLDQHFRHQHFYLEPDKKILFHYLGLHFPERSTDELHGMVCQSLELLEEHKNYRELGIFYWLLHFGEKMLFQENQRLHVHFDHLLRWKEVTLGLPEDWFVCAFLAAHDLKRFGHPHRTFFGWPTHLGAYNPLLTSVLNKGLSDNHAHMDACPSIFMASWVSLMNQVVGRKNELDKVFSAKHLEARVFIFANIRMMSLTDLIRMAAYLRYLLVSNMYEEIDVSKDDHRRYLYAIKHSITTDPIFLQLYLSNLQDDIEGFRLLKGFPKLSEEGDFVPDYACARETTSLSKPLSESVIYMGERKLIYSYLLGLMQGESRYVKWGNLFYVYLMIQARFRAELIQSNGVIGFDNFYNYQNRKDQLVEHDERMKRHRILLFLSNRLEDNEYRKGITEQDLRFTPKKSAEEMREKIRKVEPIDDRLSLIAHMIKEKDDTGKMNFDYYPRHTKKREEVNKQAFAIASMRDAYVWEAFRLKGIDTANNELWCRCEVFAQAVRFLRKHEPDFISPMKKILLSLSASEVSNALFEKKFGIKVNPAPTLTTQKSPPLLHKLRIKAHCGEEFYDIADGLRYIDECLRFFDMQRGECLGHFLAAGVEAQEFYDLKNYRITLSKQDYLDNVVWLLGASDRYGILIPSDLYRHLVNEYLQMFHEIFGEESDYPPDWIFYYESWKLRGDNPELYDENGRFHEPLGLKLWDRCGKNDAPFCIDALRNDRKVCLLYYRYHFDARVKEKGSKMMTFKCPENYVALISKLQSELRREVADREIFIEVFPSCNKAMSTFRRYDKHPILVFHPVVRSDALAHRLHTSISTDNAAVFSTTLENEFALMCLGLQKAKDASGNRLYSDDVIMTWINRVREMNLEQLINPRRVDHLVPVARFQENSTGYRIDPAF